MTQKLEDTLQERGKRYGSFREHSVIAQGLQNEMRKYSGWTALADDQKQALTVIADKIARILNGDPDYVDNWHDMQGYAKLVEDRLNEPPAALEKSESKNVEVVINEAHAQELAFIKEKERNRIRAYSGGRAGGKNRFSENPALTIQQQAEHYEVSLIREAFFKEFQGARGIFKVMFTHASKTGMAEISIHIKPSLERGFHHGEALSRQIKYWFATQNIVQAYSFNCMAISGNEPKGQWTISIRFIKCNVK